MSWYSFIPIREMVFCQSNTKLLARSSSNIIKKFRQFQLELAWSHGMHGVQALIHRCRGTRAVIDEKSAHKATFDFDHDNSL